MTEQTGTSERSTRLLKVGLFLPSGEVMMGGETAGWSQLLALSQRAEKLGFDSLWLADHMLLSTDESEVGGWECWSLLAALAAVTTRIELGPLVSCTGYRNPAMLAKIADTVDEISGGRLILGLGAGWAESEFRALGLPFDNRTSRFEEAIQIISGLLRQRQVDIHGAFYSARDCSLRPAGPRPEGPSIMVGAGGPRMLELTARYADSWNANFGSTPETIVELNGVMDAACHQVGRDPATLGRSASILVNVAGHGKQGDNWVTNGREERALSGSSEEIANALRTYAAAGIDHVQVWLDPNTIAGVEAFAPVLTLLNSD